MPWKSSLDVTFCHRYPSSDVLSKPQVPGLHRPAIFASLHGSPFFARPIHILFVYGTQSRDDYAGFQQ
jgi:hypothetical protein